MDHSQKMLAGGNGLKKYTIVYFKHGSLHSWNQSFKSLPQNENELIIISTTHRSVLFLPGRLWSTTLGTARRPPLPLLEPGYCRVTSLQCSIFLLDLRRHQVIRWKSASKCFYLRTVWKEQYPLKLKGPNSPEEDADCTLFSWMSVPWTCWEGDC